MKNMISSVIKTTAIFSLFILSSCSSSSDPGDPSNCDNFQSVSQTFVDAAILYGQDPSTENCKTYKTATEDYLEIIKECGLLTSSTGIQETEELIESLDC